MSKELKKRGYTYHLTRVSDIASVAQNHIKSQELIWD